MTYQQAIQQMVACALLQQSKTSLHSRHEFEEGVLRNILAHLRTEYFPGRISIDGMSLEPQISSEIMVPDPSSIRWEQLGAGFHLPLR